ncbi:hypothetical protein [Agathobacter sp.]
MKKITGIMLTCFLMICNSIYIYADDTIDNRIDILTQSNDYNEITDRKEEIENELPDIQLEYEKGVKVYIDTNIINLNTSDREVIQDALSSSNYVWVIPYEKENQYGEVTIARGQPLNEDAKDILTTEEQQYIIDREGKWTVTENSHGVEKTYYDIIMENIDNINECKKVIIVGSQPGLNMPIALALNDSNASNWISLGYSYPVLADVPTVMSDENNMVYDFETIADFSKKYDTVSDESGGFGSTIETNKADNNKTIGKTVIIILSVVGIFVVISLFAITIRRKNSHSIN